MFSRHAEGFSPIPLNPARFGRYQVKFFQPRDYMAFSDQAKQAAKQGLGTKLLGLRD